MSSNKNNRKFYSNKQENMIASLLGWRQVTGSGARPFHVGDVVGPDWLGECKTHMSITRKIIFKSSVWNKIRTEAQSCNKFAVYFADDGSQSVTHTFCVISSKANPFNFIDVSSFYSINHTSAGNISLDSDNFKLYSKQICRSMLNHEAVILLSLNKFYELLQ